MKSLDLSGKTALVCGASEGMGRATAQMMAERGAKIIAVARTEEKLKNLITSLKGSGHEFLSLDLSQIDVIKTKLLPFLAQREIHILINNAGGPKSGLLHEAKVEEFLAPLQAHLFASHLIAQAVIPGMKQAQYGRIVNIISTSVKIPIPGLGVSNTVRGAMANWSKTLAGELAEFGITVNNLLPGFIKTGRFDAIAQVKAKTENITVPQAEEQMRNYIPMKRIGLPEEVAEAISFLASPAAAYITGINLPVDGGRTQSL